MKPNKLLIALTSLCLFISLVSFAPGNASLLKDVLTHTNKFRQSKGLATLTMRQELNAIAQKHSADMASGRAGFGHGGFNKRYALARNKIKPMRSFAENVAHGATSGVQVVSMWKSSPGHRRNMLGKFKYIGIGIAKDKRGRIFYTQVFAG